MDASVFIALFVGHTVGDHWVQTGHQAAHKHLPGKEGHLSCLRHVAGLTATKIILLLPLLNQTDVNPLFLCAGLMIDALSHYWADRRTTLERLAKWLGKGDFYRLGTDTTHRQSPDGSHIGTGWYALDQSFHYFFLFVSATMISM